MSRLREAAPGLIEGLSSVEASMIGTYAYIFGANGTSLLWAVLLPFILWPFIEYAASVIGSEDHVTFLEVIRRRFGDVPAAISALSLMASNVSAMVVEVTAASLAISMLFQARWPLFIPVSMAILFLAPSVTGKRWTAVILAGSLPMLAFPAAAVLYVLHGSAARTVAGGILGFGAKFDGGDVAALIGATVAPDALFFAEESGYEERSSFLGIGAGDVIGLIISLSLAVTFAVSFHGSSPTDLTGIASSLVPVMGRLAYVAFPIALFSSCMTSFAVALKPWLSSLSFLTGRPLSSKDEFLPGTLGLVFGGTFLLGFMVNWHSLAFEEAAYTSGLISSVGLVLPLILMSYLIVKREKTALTVKVFGPLYAAIIVSIVVLGLIVI
ncbi:divalent metal cation transporter [Tardisphaera saccharovorans]